jgi:rhodanese-related sulfurtransferase
MKRSALMGRGPGFDGPLNRFPRLIFAAREATLAPDWRGAGEPPKSRSSGGLCVANHQVHDLTPEDVAKGMAEGRYLLVDVREPNEVAVEAYPGGVVVPLSTFDPATIPDPKGKQVVFACRSGKRSVTASLAAQAAGLPYDKHLAGGILGWKAAGLQTKTGG